MVSGRILYFLFFILSISCSGSLYAQDDTLKVESQQQLVVGINEQPPFAIAGEGDSWDGISVRLWRAVADSLNITYRFSKIDPAQSAKSILDEGVDLYLLGDVTSKAEAEVDFSHIYYTSKSGVATAGSIDLSKLAKAFFNKRFWKITLVLAVLLLIVGTIIYLVERGSNEDHFGGERSVAKGIGSGFWWAGVTMTTIGYGDKAPVTFVGRALALIWMLIAMAVTAVLTASLVSVVMGASGTQKIDAPGDLRDMKIAAVEGSAGLNYLKAERIAFRSFANLSEAIQSVNSGEFEVVLHTVPELRYEINNDPDLSLKVQSLNLDPRFYAFSMVEEDSLREQINLGLLRILNTALWQQELDRFIPEKKSK